MIDYKILDNEVIIIKDDKEVVLNEVTNDLEYFTFNEILDEITRYIEFNCYKDNELKGDTKEERLHNKMCEVLNKIYLEEYPNPKYGYMTEKEKAEYNEWLYEFEDFLNN